MASRLVRPSKNTTFVLLMALAALLALFFPARWAGRLRGFVQPFALLQWPASAVTRTAVEVLQDDVPRLTPKQIVELERRAAELARQVGHQQLRIDELQSQNAELAGLRRFLPDTRATIVTAPVVSFDSNPRRQALLIGRGAPDGLRVGQWVAAGTRAAERDPEASGRDWVERQWLIGRISEVQPHFSWVQLTNDPTFREMVRAARVGADGTWEPADHDAILLGRGVGGIIISQAPRNYLETGHTIVLAPRTPSLPAALTLGYIRAARPVDTSPQHFDLTVEPWGNPRRLGYVFVIAVAEGPARRD